MIRRLTYCVTLFALLASPSFAEELKLEKKVCASEQCAAGECSSSTCPIEAGMAKLPRLTYQVGNESTCCAETAAKLAAKHESPVKFVVAEKSYGSEADATHALAEVTERFVSEFVTPKKCDVSGKVAVAGKELCCDVMAAERAEVAKQAMDKVAMTYLVGNQSCACPHEAAKLAQDSGKEQVFVIANEKTCCGVDARVKLARAKYKAAVEALVKLDTARVDGEL